MYHLIGQFIPNATLLNKRVITKGNNHDRLKTAEMVIDSLDNEHAACTVLVCSPFLLPGRAGSILSSTALPETNERQLNAAGAARDESI